MRIVSLVGNRPQFVKAAPLCTALRAQERAAGQHHTGDHRRTSCQCSQHGRVPRYRATGAGLPISNASTAGVPPGKLFDAGSAAPTALYAVSVSCVAVVVAWSFIVPEPAPGSAALLSM